MSSQSLLGNKTIGDDEVDIQQLVYRAYEDNNYLFNPGSVSKNFMNDDHLWKRIFLDSSYMPSWQAQVLKHIKNGVVKESFLNRLYMQPIQTYNRIDLVMFLYSNPGLRQFQTFSALNNPINSSILNLIKGTLAQNAQFTDIFQHLLSQASSAILSENIHCHLTKQLEHYVNRPLEFIEFSLTHMGLTESNKYLYLLSLTYELNQSILFEKPSINVETFIYAIAIIAANNYLQLLFCKSMEIKNHWLEQINAIPEILSHNNALLDRAFVWNKILLDA